MSYKRLKTAVAAWIETYPLAEALVDIMCECAEQPGEEMTLDNAKKLWLNFLETELSDGLKRCVQYISR